jgi:hypothetical protein
MLFDSILDFERGTLNFEQQDLLHLFFRSGFGPANSALFEPETRE